RLRARIESHQLFCPRCRFAQCMAKHVQSHSDRSSPPLEMAGPAPLMPASVERWTNITAITTSQVIDPGRGQHIQEVLERSSVTEQIAILRSLGDPVVDACQAACDRADHAAIAELSHQVFV